MNDSDWNIHLDSAITGLEMDSLDRAITKAPGWDEVMQASIEAESVVIGLLNTMPGGSDAWMTLQKAWCHQMAHHVYFGLLEGRRQEAEKLATMLRVDALRPGTLGLDQAEPDGAP